MVFQTSSFKLIYMNFKSNKYTNLQLNGCNFDLYNDDCIDILKNMQTESIQFACIDGPYNIGFSNGHSKDKQKWDNRSNKDFKDFTIEWLNEVYRILTPTGTLFTFYGFTEIQLWFEILKETKFTNHLENAIVFARCKGRGSKSKLKSIREDLFHLTKDPEKYTWNTESYLRKVIAPYKLAGGVKRGWDYGPDGKTPMRFTGLANVIPLFMEPGFENNKKGTVLDIASGIPMAWSGADTDIQFPTIPSYNNKMEKQIHSCQKPVMLLSMLTMLCSNPGDTILDCFAGSMSTGVAAMITGRNFYGIESSSDTFELGLKRLQETEVEKWNKFISVHIDTTKEPAKFKFGLST
jgi:site-specific DNA-methyltransferase (adenine-specific)